MLKKIGSWSQGDIKSLKRNLSVMVHRMKLYKLLTDSTTILHFLAWKSLPQFDLDLVMTMTTYDQILKVDFVTDLLLQF